MLSGTTSFLFNLYPVIRSLPYSSDEREGVGNIMRILSVQDRDSAYLTMVTASLNVFRQ
jgi:hypothetical protein